ncbi:MAG: TIR domain-containing protein, partial [Anaerolineae bacterium]|nr:TIR domain-containing protein [Anaerolineae bacterium]
MADKRKVFISYAWRDGKEVARWLHDRFNAAEGWSAWMDIKLYADTLFSHELQVRIETRDLVVVVVSPDVNRHETPSFVQRELMHALDSHVNKPVFASRAHDCQLPLIIQGYTYVDFFDSAAYETQFAALLELIERGSGSSPDFLKHSRRKRELAYLRQIAADHSFWGKVYLDPSAQASVRAAPDGVSIEEEDEEIASFLSEIGVKVYRSDGHSAPDDRHEKVESFASLNDALSRFRRVAIIGDPGSGKTTTLRRFAYRLGDSAAKDEDAPLPLFVRLGAYEGENFDAYLAASFGGLALTDYLPDRVVLLLDGLNETSHGNIPAIQEWLKRNSGVRVMLTCRKLDYEERRLDLQRVDVLPLDMGRVVDFMRAYKLSEAERGKLFWGLAGAEVRDIWERFEAAGLGFEIFWRGDELTLVRYDNRSKTYVHPAASKTSLDQKILYNRLHHVVSQSGCSLSQSECSISQSGCSKAA